VCVTSVAHEPMNGSGSPPQTTTSGNSRSELGAASSSLSPLSPPTVTAHTSFTGSLSLVYCPFTQSLGGTLYSCSHCTHKLTVHRTATSLVFPHYCGRVLQLPHPHLDREERRACFGSPLLRGGGDSGNADSSVWLVVNPSLLLGPRS
jgi:hypothetical protein